MLKSWLGVIKAYQQIFEKLGSKCQICNADLTKKRWFHAHEIYGKSHKHYPQFILKHLEDFVLLCPKCHRGIHFCMNYLGLSWKQISDLIHGEALNTSAT